jgi:pilus assembly protein CpaB
VILFGGSHGGALTGATTDVVVAARDIPLRGVIGPDDVTTQKFADADVPPSSFRKTSDVQHLIAELQIAKGQALTSNMLARSPDQISGLTPGFLAIPQGFVAVTMPTSELQGVAGYIQPNDYISIIATTNLTTFAGPNQQGPAKLVSKTVFTNVHVLRVGAASNQVTPASGSSSQQTTNTAGAAATSITFIVTACDAEFLQWFRATTTLSYELESFHDYKPQDTTPNATCANVDAAHGVGPKIVDQRYGFTQLQ